MVHHTSSSTLLFLLDFEVKLLNFTFYGGRKHATTRFYMSLSGLDMVS